MAIMMEDRVIELSNRPQGIREKKSIPIKEFDLEEIKSQFDKNISNVKTKFSICDKLMEEGNIEESKDILRTQIVFLESAFDYYMHGLTKYGMNKMFDGEWKKTEKYCNFMIPLKTVEDAINNVENSEWFNKIVNNSYSDKTFMSYDKVKEQFNLLGFNAKDIADAAFYQQGDNIKTTKKMQQKINQLFNRRNSIAHQTDRYHENGEQQDIDKEYVQNSIEDIVNLVNAINDMAIKKNAN